MEKEVWLQKGEKMIAPSDPRIIYTGRIDMENPKEPCLVYVGSSLRFRFTGTKVKLLIQNHHCCYHNYLGICIDGQIQEKVEILEHEKDYVITMAQDIKAVDHENVQEQVSNAPLHESMIEQADNAKVHESMIEQYDNTAVHEIIIYKCQDSSHYVTLKGIILDHRAVLLDPPKRSERRIECFGDSVSCGEVSEAIEYVGKTDPVNEGEYSNSWYSYASITARNLGAELHNISQGGIALFDDTGWFHGPDYVGLLSTYDKIKYNTYLGPVTPWDFTKYIPHVVIIAIGQNDAHPDDYMGLDPDKSEHWKKSYEEFIRKLQRVYPKALFILTTTILEHKSTWDDAIDEVAKRMNNPKIVHFLYSKNGCGTPGHIRIPEAEQMAKELTAFINSFGKKIWNED